MRPPATPLTVVLLNAVLTHRRGRDVAGGTRSGPWPLSAWWEEALGQAGADRPAR